MKKFFTILFILAGLTKICELHLQTKSELACSSFVIPECEDDDDDSDSDAIINHNFPETSEEYSFCSKPQSAFIAYLHDIFWLGKNKYM